MDVVNSTLQNLINENVNAFADVFEIISKNINIADKVQVGLTNKTLNQIMKPIIKKDDIRVLHCNCFEYKNNELCRVEGQCLYWGDQKICCSGESKKISKIIEDEKIKNVVVFGCDRLDLFHLHSKIDNLVTNLRIIDNSKNIVHVEKFNTSHRYEIMDVSDLSYKEKEENHEYQYYDKLRDKTIWCSWNTVGKEIEVKKRTPSKMFGEYLYNCYKDEWYRVCESDNESDYE